MSFNPRPRVGGDQACYGGNWDNGAFQSTPPRGGRLARVPLLRLVCGFNPRPRVGGDRATIGSGANTGKVSIHAPAWGATADVIHFCGAAHVSIHAPAWGATAD
jgi:hypothetical protein